MASAVYNSSPRHLKNRVPSNASTNSAHHHRHLSNHSTKIVFPQTSYIASGAPSPTTTNYYHNRHPLAQLTQQQHHSIVQQQQQHQNGQLQQQLSRHRTHRKSAVELLAESKPFYVKSETVLDRQQQLTHYRSGSCVISPSRTLPHQRDPLITSNRRSSSSSSSDLLQAKLRKLLYASDNNKSSYYSGVNAELNSTKYHSDSSPNSKCESINTNKYVSSKSKTKQLSQELSVQPDLSNDLSVFFPSAFLSPQSLPPHPASDDDIYSFGIDDILIDDYQTISPPAEYAENTKTTSISNRRRSKVSENPITNRYNCYQRSYSHSQAFPERSNYNQTAYNINSHKSLPDLHSQTSSRHSPHSEELSCCSRGNRSNKSGSSFNRDSGGSSGHYTHQSEPYSKQKEANDLCLNIDQNCPADFRRDSGSSTQHSANSYYAYGIPPVPYDFMPSEYRGGDTSCLLNFTTPEVPEAFQDNYNDMSPPLITSPPRRYYDGGDKQYSFDRAQQRSRYKHMKSNATKNKSPDRSRSVDQQPDLSPPLGVFKRQRCLRYKQRGRYSSPGSRSAGVEEDNRPILRSKSDISDRYWSRIKAMEKRSQSESAASQLERFFDRLGLNDDKYEEFIVPKSAFNSDDDSNQSSPVFFSDVSTVDSTRLPDSTDTSNGGNGQTFRPSEPPSIVERNARIIKWLCNCRKLQLP